MQAHRERASPTPRVMSPGARPAWSPAHGCGRAAWPARPPW